MNKKKDDRKQHMNEITQMNKKKKKIERDV